PPLTLEGAVVTVNGRYSLLPCALSTSSRTQAIDRSSGAGCPAPTSSTIFTTFWISFFCASSCFLTSFWARRVEPPASAAARIRTKDRRSIETRLHRKRGSAGQGNDRRLVAAKSNRCPVWSSAAGPLCYHRNFG